MQISKNLSDVKILVFWEILKNNENVFLLNELHNENTKYSNQELILLTEKWQQLYDEYFKLKDSAESRAILRNNFKKLELVQKISIIEYIRDSYVALSKLSNNKEFHVFIVEKTKELNDVFKAVCPKVKNNQIANIEQIVEVCDTTIKSYKNMFNEKNALIQKEVGKEVDSIFKLSLILSKAIGVKIEPNNMSVIDWIDTEKLAVEAIKQRS